MMETVQALLMKIRVVLAIFALAAGCAVEAAAQDEPKTDLVPQVGFPEVIQSLWVQAEQGIPQAQFNLGLRYDTGEGVPQNDSEAVKWYRRAAEQGLAEARNNLGLMYDKGEGVPQDDSEAVKWYRRAAEQGLAAAQYNLGVSHFTGRGVPQNYSEAALWYRRAAGQGYAEAQHHLGVMHYNGTGVSQNYREAYIWLSLAVANGDMSAEEGRNKVARRMSSAELSSAQKEATRRHTAIQGGTDN